MAAEQAEVVSQHMAVERLAELRAERTATNSSGEATENGAGYRAKCDTDRPGDSAERCAGLAACQSSANATCETAYGADGCAGFHGVME